MLFNSSGSSSLATAGTGDVLSGIIGAMLCNSKISTLDATALSVFIHGKAGEIAEKRVGVRGSTADDILECIPPAMKLISPFA